MSSKDSRRVPSTQHSASSRLLRNRCTPHDQTQQPPSPACPNVGLLGWGDMGMAGPLQSRADPGSSSGSVTASRVVLGKTLLPSGSELPHGITVSLPRWAGAPREAVSPALKVGMESFLLQGVLRSSSS